MYIVSISIDNRKECIPEVQEVLTRYGKNITTRLGLHDPKKENKGIIIVAYQEDNVEEFIEELNCLPKSDVNYMEA